MNNLTNTWRQPATARARALMGAALSAVTVGLVMTGQAAAQQAAEVQEVTITGTRIKAPNLTSESPVSQVTSDEIKQSGAANLDVLLNTLPEVYASQGNTTSNGSNGTSTLNLRALGAGRTLVLIDGRRIGPSSLTSQAADINLIPAVLVTSVEVLTGGASAVYGSDAIAGVVNFHFLRNFEGVMFDENFNAAQHSQHASSFDNNVVKNAPYLNPVAIPGDQFDGFNRDTTAVMGINSPNNKGNLTAWVEYRATSPVLSGSRDWNACGTGLNSTKTALICSGSGTNAYELITQNGTGKNYALNPNGTATLVPYNGLSMPYNFNPLNFLQRQEDRTSLGTLGHYQVTPWLDVYTELMFMRDSSNAQIAPGGLFYGGGPASGTKLTVPCNNQFLSAAEATILCVDTKGNPMPVYQANGTTPNVFQFNTLPGYRFASFPRQTLFHYDDVRAVVGGRGDIDSNWSYDVSLSYYNQDLQQTALNNVSFTRLQDSLNNCASGSTACVPVNIFQYGALTPAMVNYISAPGLFSQNIHEYDAQANLTGDLTAYGVKSPFAKNGMAVAFGVEYRRDEGSLLPDNEYQTGDLLGQGGNVLPYNAAEAYREYYAEARTPLIENKPFIDSMNLDLAIRHTETIVENSNNAFSANTYKITADYAPTSDLRFRGGYNRADRAPNLGELFAPATFGTLAVSSGDPCAGPTPQASAAACSASGLSAALYGKVPQCVSNQCEQLSGGNTALKPEIADTWTWGVNLTPSFVPGFNMSVDYWDVRVDNYITTLSGSAIINGCILNGTSSLCPFIHRNPLTGDIGSVGQGYIAANNANFGFLHNRGIDFEANYRKSLEDFGIHNMGAVTMKFVGTEALQSTISGLVTYDCQGLYGTICDGNGASDPRFNWRHTAAVTWNTPWDADITFKWRYFSSVSLDTNNSQKALNNGSYDAADATIPSVSYLDISAAYQLWNKYTFRVGVNNVLDKDPPIISQTAVPTAAATNGNTYTGTYDSLGRVIFMNFNAKF
jgi:iron complex outermembrane receptor protein